MSARRLTLLAPIAALSLTGCGLNSIPTAEETAKARWADVQNEYQRRADLVPNLVSTVKGYARAGEGRAARRDPGARPRRIDPAGAG